MICPYGCKPKYVENVEANSMYFDSIELCAVHSLTERLVAMLDRLHDATNEPCGDDCDVQQLLSEYEAAKEKANG